MTRGQFAATLFAAIMSASAAQALSFNLNWTSTPSTSLSTGTVTAVGLIEVDAAAGEAFTLDDLIALSILVSGDAITDFSLSLESPVAILSGQIASDGLTASLTDFYFEGNSPDAVFGCNSLAGDCASVETSEGVLHNIISGRDENGVPFLSLYDTPEEALASVEFTQPEPEIDVIPLPASAPLLLAAFGFMALLRRRARAA